MVAKKYVVFLTTNSLLRPKRLIFLAKGCKGKIHVSGRNVEATKMSHNPFMPTK